MAHEVTQEEIQMIEEKVARARVAQDVIAQYSQERVDKLIQAVGAAVTNMKVWAPICDEAVDDVRQWMSRRNPFPSSSLSSSPLR